VAAQLAAPQEELSSVSNKQASRATFYFIHQDYRLIRMACPHQLIQSDQQEFTVLPISFQLIAHIPIRRSVISTLKASLNNPWV
jgi:hypothetical protein